MFSGKSPQHEGNTPSPAQAAGTRTPLTVGAENDPLEAEADAMADKVMRMPEGNAIQRKCAHCEEEEKAQRKPQSSFIQKKEAEGGSVASDTVTSSIEASRGSGQAMPDTTRSFMESRFGADFSGVRIHTGSEAAQLSDELQAQAFTVGNDIYFNKGKFSPESSDGQRLLAHELTHTLQQQGAPTLRNKLIQRDLAVAPTVARPTVRALTTAEIAAAIAHNRVVFTDADEIAELRDVLGISPTPATVNEAFIRAIARYQASFGIAQDGMLNADTALRLANELRGEANFLGAAADTGRPDKMALNPAARRMRLRSRVADRLGTLLHQGFVGARDRPDGIVTVRSGVDYQTMCGTLHNCLNGIQLDYTGSDADNAHWLQFISARISANDPGSGNRVFHSGSVQSSGGLLNLSDNTTTHWAVDSADAADPFYEGGFTDERNAGRNTSIFDQPQRWQGVADSFATSAFATRPASATLVLSFDAYLVVNNQAVYHVRWDMTFVFNTSVTPTADVAGTYAVVGAGAVANLPAALRTVLLARYAGSPIR